MIENRFMWIFCGAGSRFPSGLFSSKEQAIKWINKHKLTGVLTKYPVDEGVYEWCIKKGVFTPKKDHESTASFIQAFSSAFQEHFHFEDGHLD